VSQTQQEQRRPAAGIATAVGEALAGASQAAGPGQTQDAAEIQAITQAMVRLLVGVPLHCDGQLTIKSLAHEAGLRRNKLTHKHTGLKDLFYALVRSQDHRPKIADSLHTDNDRLRAKLTDLRAEHNKLKQRLATFARVVHVLEAENAQLREQSQPGATIQPLHRRPR
jgi:hypothetical protein